MECFSDFQPIVLVSWPTALLFTPTVHIRTHFVSAVINSIVFPMMSLWELFFLYFSLTSPFFLKMAFIIFSDKMQWISHQVKLIILTCLAQKLTFRRGQHMTAGKQASLFLHRENMSWLLIHWNQSMSSPEVHWGVAQWTVEERLSEK